MDIQGILDILMILRLQIGCFCISIAIAVPFFMVKRTVNFAHKLFRYMIFMQIITLSFDMITVYTVNNPDAVSAFTNKLMHIIFISGICVFVYLTFLYVRQLVTNDNRRIWLFVYGTPVIIAVITVIIAPLYYVENEMSNYSAGRGVTVIYFVVVIYLMVMLYVVIRYRKRIDGDKSRIILVALLTQICISVAQFCIPALLITSLGATIITLAIYLTIENPDRILRELYLREKLKAEEAKREIEEIAYTDTLTGIINRRQFFILASAQIERLKRQNGNAFIIIFDIDRFKDVNDTYGHLIGDKVLKYVVDRVKETIRPYDLFGRYGGEEFTIFVPDISSSDILIYTERLRMAINGSPLEIDDLKMTLSASFGVVPINSAEDLTGIINAADEALYKAKAAGRNKVVISDSKEML